jgi:acyl-CoA thioesterase FadM
MHTDSNMHVNSLVYLRLFEEAALRRFVALGRGAQFLGRTVDLVYRRPCFAGQTVRVLVGAFEVGGRLGAVARLLDEADAEREAALSAAKPHAYVRLMFE